MVPLSTLPVPWIRHFPVSLSHHFRVGFDPSTDPTTYPLLAIAAPESPVGFVALEWLTATVALDQFHCRRRSTTLPSALVFAPLFLSFSSHLCGRDARCSSAHASMASALDIASPSVLSILVGCPFVCFHVLPILPQWEGWSKEELLGQTRVGCMEGEWMHGQTCHGPLVVLHSCWQLSFGRPILNGLVLEGSPCVSMGIEWKSEVGEDKPFHLKSAWWRSFSMYGSCESMGRNILAPWCFNSRCNNECKCREGVLKTSRICRHERWPCPNPWIPNPIASTRKISCSGGEGCSL